MRILMYLLQKEFIQIFRNRIMLPVIFLLPLVQFTILVFAATFELKRIDIAVVDQDHSVVSAQLINQIGNNPIFHVDYFPQTVNEAEELMRRNKADLVLTIPHDFSKKLATATHPDVQILADAIVGNSAQLGSAYLSQIIYDFNKNVLIQGMESSTPSIHMLPRYLYNSALNYKIYMAPGILMILITVVGMMLGGMNFVREKEIGTIEQINVTPIKKWQFIAGKMLPFLIIGLFELAFGMTLGHFIFQMPVRGSLLLLFGATTIYLVLILSIGLYLSAISDTQQQVTFSAFFFVMVFILMSGLFTPVESMPTIARYMDYANPLLYFIRILRGVILKGATLPDIWHEIAILSAYAIVMFSLAIKRYRKTT